MTTKRVRAQQNLGFITAIKVGDKVRLVTGPSLNCVGTVIDKHGYRLRISIGDIRTVSQCTAHVRRVRDEN